MKNLGLIAVTSILLGSCISPYCTRSMNNQQCAGEVVKQSTVIGEIEMTTQRVIDDYERVKRQILERSDN